MSEKSFWITKHNVNNQSVDLVHGPFRNGLCDIQETQKMLQLKEELEQQISLEMPGTFYRISMMITSSD